MTAKAGLFVCSAGLGILSLVFPDRGLLELALACLGCLGLILLKELNVEYRIRKGLFGTTKDEARDMLRYIVSNARDIDFKDGNGGLRRVLLPKEHGTALAVPATTPDGMTA